MRFSYTFTAALLSLGLSAGPASAQVQGCIPGFNCKISTKSVAETHPGFTPEMPTRSVTVSEVTNFRLPGLNPDERLCKVKCPVSVENPEGGQVTGCYEICKPHDQSVLRSTRIAQPVPPVDPRITHYAPRPPAHVPPVIQPVPPKIEHIIKPYYYRVPTRQILVLYTTPQRHGYGGYGHGLPANQGYGFNGYGYAGHNFAGHNFAGHNFLGNGYAGQAHGRYPPARTPCQMPVQQRRC